MDGLRPIADYLPAVMAEMNRPRLAVRADGGFDVLDPDIPGSVYEIGDDILESAEKAFCWIRQLGDKRWVSKQTFCDLADAVLAHIKQQREGEWPPKR